MKRLGLIIPNCYCPNCDKILTVELLSHDMHGYCTNCYEFCGTLRDEENCCMNSSHKIVKKYIKDGRIQLKKQCENCYDIIGHAISQNGLDLNIIPEVELEKNKEYDEKRQNEFNHFREKFRKQFSNREKVNVLLLDSQFNYETYTSYIASNEWKNKRKLVLERDKFICQACLIVKATQVHHITYKHLMNEPLFELVSVCQPCHVKITIMDKGEYFLSTQNKLYENLLS